MQDGDAASSVDEASEKNQSAASFCLEGAGSRKA